MRRLRIMSLSALAALLAAACSEQDTPAADGGATVDAQTQDQGASAEAAATSPEGASPAPAAYVMPADIPDFIRAAVENPARPEADRARDAARKPGHVIAFAGVAPGDTVLDLSAGGGYYTRILSKIVGEEGKINAINWDWVVERFGDSFQDFVADVDSGSLPNVSYSVQQTDAFSVPEQVDYAFFILDYHDVHWSEVDASPEGVNASVFNALKPGGIYLVVDHRAPEGTGAETVDALHRIDPELVLEEVTAAGFEWIGESDALANPDDPHDVDWFGEWRGRTDRFIYKFRKP